MIVKNNIINLNNILGNLSFDCYYNVNYKNGKRKYKYNQSYSLNDEALKCLELLKIANKNDITIDEEEEIKAFLLRYKLLNGSYLLDNKEYIKLKVS